MAAQIPPREAGAQVAVLLTCYNRRVSTLESLRHVFTQELPQGASISVFLVDDGSGDGTSTAVTDEFPQIKLLQGNGKLYWSGGMRLAFGEALKRDFDFYLWLNDDTLLDGCAMARLLSTYHALAAKGNDCVIVVGSTYDPQTGALTYGGVRNTSRIHPFKFQLIEPAAEARLCTTMNGNVVLIPRTVAQKMGNISQAFTHGMGDFDYGLRARRVGCSIWIAPGYAGSCRRNGAASAFSDTSLPFHAWWRGILGAKGLPPGDYWRLMQAHGGPLWPVFWAMPYLRATLTWVGARIRP